MFIFMSLYITDVFLASIVIPLSFSISFESITLSSTCSLLLNVPLCFNRLSTKVVLPWSTCAIIATFLIFSLIIFVFPFYIIISKLLNNNLLYSIQKPYVKQNLTFFMRFVIMYLYQLHIGGINKMRNFSRALFKLLCAVEAFLIGCFYGANNQAHPWSTIMIVFTVCFVFLVISWFMGSRSREEEEGEGEE